MKSLACVGLLLKPGLPEKSHWDGLTVPMLRMELERRGLSSKGSKSKLVDRLNSCGEDSHASSLKYVKPGTQGISHVATARVTTLTTPPVSFTRTKFISPLLV